MSVHVLLSLLNELRKSDKMRGLPINMNDRKMQRALGDVPCDIVTEVQVI